MTHPLCLDFLTAVEAAPPELATLAAANGCESISILAHPSPGVPDHGMDLDSPPRRETLNRCRDLGIAIDMIEGFFLTPESLAKVYVTGNHEYFGEAQGWLDHMAELGWEPLHNRHIVVERGGDSLVLAGVDDVTAASSGLAGHRANLVGALEGADPELPVLLVAHQPKYVGQAAGAGIDLQVSGHTHGGQIWPFNYLVRIDQPVVQGLSRHGERTQLYTSRGTGFWGPPFRIFAPSEITLLTLRSA